MKIEKAQLRDLDAIMGLYTRARSFMAETGNPTQWGSNYPERQRIEADISQEHCYICVDDDGVQAVFVFMICEESTYAHIDGAWKNEAPYGVMHRMAGSGNVKGIADMSFDFCKSQIANLRADTHSDNKIMQHLLEKNGFERCGIIRVEDGTPRIAYQYVRR